MITPDSGVDGGPAADCTGLVPPPPGAAVTFDVPALPDQVCGGSAVDGQGFVAASARSASKPQWIEFDRNGIRSGTFDGPAELFAQPKGFMGIWGATRLAVTLWDSGGGGVPGSTAATSLGPAFGTGVIALFADSTSLTVTKVDPDLNEVGSAIISGAFVPRAAAEDVTGAVLALTGTGTDVVGLWIDLTKGTAGRPFAIGAATSLKARALLGGGIAVQLDGRWAGVAQPGQSAMVAAPSWLGEAADFSPARGGKAHALVPATGNVVGIASAQGNLCGSVTFPGVSSVSIGIDGTVVGSTGTRGCTRYVWRSALR